MGAGVEQGVSSEELAAKALFEYHQGQSVTSHHLLPWRELSDDTKESWRRQVRVVTEAALPAMYRQLQSYAQDNTRNERLIVALLRRLEPDVGRGVRVHAAEMRDETEGLYRVHELTDTATGDVSIWLTSVPQAQPDSGR